jgi:hypothetical protein
MILGFVFPTLETWLRKQQGWEANFVCAAVKQKRFLINSADFCSQM